MTNLQKSGKLQMEVILVSREWCWTLMLCCKQSSWLVIWLQDLPGPQVSSLITFFLVCP